MTLLAIRLLLLPLIAATEASAATESAADTDASGAISFCAHLSPDEESAPTYSVATGLGRFSLRRADLLLSWEVSFRDLTSPLASANVHGPQRPGANAQVLFPLAAEGPFTSPIRGSLTLTDGQLEYLLTGRMYVNLATGRYPEGELRAQIQRIRPGTSCTSSPAPAT